MKHNHHPFYIFIAIILFSVINILGYKADSAHTAPKAKSTTPVSAPSASVTSETTINSGGAGAFMIVLMILKWFFLERRVDK